MSEATVRASIKTLIEAVDNVGMVYDREPFTNSWANFVEQFKCNVLGREQIRAFTISCETIPRERLTVASARNSHNQGRLTYKIRGYCGFNYECDTENEFLGVVIAVLDKLDTGIVTGNAYNAPVAQLDSYVPRTFDGILCHYAEITQEVIEVIT